MLQNISAEKINLIIDISLRAGLYTFLIFSYWFGFNKGYGQLALKQLIKKSTELGILRLIAGVSLNNKPSWKALEKVGFLPINCDDGYQYFEKFWGCLLIKKV